MYDIFNLETILLISFEWYCTTRTFVQTLPLFVDIVAYRRGSQTLLQSFINKKPDGSKN